MSGGGTSVSGSGASAGTRIEVGATKTTRVAVGTEMRRAGAVGLVVAVGTVVELTLLLSHGAWPTAGQMANTLATTASVSDRAVAAIQILIGVAHDSRN